MSTLHARVLFQAVVCFLLLGFATLGEAFTVYTNNSVAVSEGTGATINALTTIDGIAVVNYNAPSYTDLYPSSNVAGPGVQQQFYYESPICLITNVADGYFYNVTLADATLRTVRQPVMVFAVNDAPVITNMNLSGSAATNVVFYVPEDQTNAVLRLSEWVLDEEDAGNPIQAATNLTYMVTASSGVTNGIINGVSSNLVFFTPNPNVSGVTNLFDFRVQDKGGKAVLVHRELDKRPVLLRDPGHIPSLRLL